MTVTLQTDTTADRVLPEPPTFADVLKARRVLSPYLKPTPLYHYPALDALIGARVLVKHENYQPIGAFKVRGGLNYMAHLPSAQQAQGVITASTGNHGQSVAYAARVHGVRAVIVAPEGANPVKVAAMRSHGAEVRLVGADFEAAKQAAQAMADEEGLRFISSGDEPLLIAGVATHTLEILEEAPEVDVVIVPVGGGSGAAGAGLVVKTLKPQAQVIGVQASASPAAYLSWQARAPRTAENRTLAEGLATGAPFLLPQRMMWEFLDDFVLVEDEEMLDAVHLYLEKAKTLAEPAGAAPLAAALRLRERLAGKTVALILSGGNISPEQLHMVIHRGMRPQP